MRTTVTLDNDVTARLERERRTRHVSFKTLLNQVLRAGLDALHSPERHRKPFRTQGFDLGPSLVGSLDNIEEVLSRSEGEDHQ